MSATITPTSHIYSKFRGVDFSSRQDEVSFYRSPDALNMWKNYKNNSGKCVETRPDLELIKEYDDAIYGIYFYEINKILHKIVHSGTKLYDDDKVIYNNMANNKTNFFVFNDKLYIKDSVSYLVYDGTEVKEVDGYIPTTTISKSPSGGGEIFQDINLLTDLRKNSFVLRFLDGEKNRYCGQSRGGWWNGFGLCNYSDLRNRSQEKGYGLGISTSPPFDKEVLAQKVGRK